MSVKLNAEKLRVNQEKLSEIKNLIFDLGGVIVDVDVELFNKSFQDIGFTNFTDIYSQIQQSSLFELFETGKIPAQIFRNELRKFKNNLSDSQIDSAWNSVIVKVPEQNIELLINLRKNYKTFVLSNTNIIHMDFLTEKLISNLGKNPFEEMFDQIYLSYEIGYRKPDKECFQYVLDKAGINAGETMFIDDLIANVNGACAAGILGYQLVDRNLVELFDENKR
jgi:putative hydrolase of the HAD superfamily